MADKPDKPRLTVVEPGKDQSTPEEQSTQQAEAPIKRSAKIHGGGKLTAKQEAFAQAVVRGCNYSEAYRQSYSYENMKPETVWVEACMTAKKPNVAERIQELISEKELENNALEATRRARVMEYLEKTMVEAKTDSARTRAAELLGKAVGAFVDKVETTKQGRADVKELEARLAKLVGKNKTG